MELTRTQAHWADVPKWEMANVHTVFFELFERVYLVSSWHDRMWSVHGGY